MSALRGGGYLRVESTVGELELLRPLRHNISEFEPTDTASVTPSSLRDQLAGMSGLRSLDLRG